MNRAPQTDPFYAFHYLNAYDESETGDILIDLSVYPDTSVINMLYIENMRNPRPDSKAWMGRERRFRLPNPLAQSVSFHYLLLPTS